MRYDQPALAYVPATRVENACATGSAALYTALDFVESGRGRIALVVGAEKMTAKPVAETSDILLSASYRKEEADIDGGFAGVFGRIAQGYFQRYGDRSEELARISAKNHRNGVSNPYAQMRRDFGFEFCNVVSDKEPLCRGAAAAHRLLADLGRRGGARRRRRGNGRAAPAGDRIPRPPTRQRFPAAVAA